MLRINWSRFRLEDFHIKLHPENLPLEKSSCSLVTFIVRIEFSLLGLIDVSKGCYHSVKVISHDELMHMVVYCQFITLGFVCKV